MSRSNDFLAGIVTLGATLCNLDYRGCLNLNISTHGIFCLMALGFAFPCTFDDFALFLHGQCLASLIFAYGNHGLGGYYIGIAHTLDFLVPSRGGKAFETVSLPCEYKKRRARLLGSGLFFIVGHSSQSPGTCNIMTCCSCSAKVARHKTEHTQDQMFSLVHIHVCVKKNAYVHLTVVNLAK